MTTIRGRAMSTNERSAPHSPGRSRAARLAFTFDRISDSRRAACAYLYIVRYHNPPWWVSLADLHAAMATRDPASGLNRGFVVVGTRE